VVEELALIRCDLDNARSEVGLLRVHAARAACVMAATADSCRRHLTTVDDAFTVAHAGAEEKTTLQGSISHESA
jgi:hypothetical protein